MRPSPSTPVSIFPWKPRTLSLNMVARPGPYAYVYCAKLGREDKMARRIQDKILDSKDARRKLQPRAKPYWRSIERGLHLGYRRLRDVAGPWIARRYLGNQRYDEQAIGIADDLSAADGLRVDDY